MADLLEQLKAALANRYQIERELGSGGMATVYLAQDLKHDRKVAVKVLRPELAAVLGAERFLNEIKVTANLQHPHILALFDSGEADSFLYYVMPYVEGESLREKLNREKQLSIEESIEIAKSVASALDYAHRHDVIHRDIKPENILLHDGQPVVADFGISLAVTAAGGTRLTETGLSLGTPQYMSPEQATGDREIDGRSDIYSLACVLYEMLTGDPPHTGPTVQAVIAKVVTDHPRPITELRDTVPSHVSAVVHKSLAKLPADRFGSAMDFTRALDDPGFRHGEEGIAAFANAAGRWRGWTLAFAALAVLFAIAFAWAITRPDDNKPVSRHRIAQAGLPEGTDDAMISPDGSMFLYSAFGNRALPHARLWLRRRDELTITQLAGTDGTSYAAFSPDGERVAVVRFELNLVLLEVLSLTGSSPLTLATRTGDTARLAAGGLGWGPDGYLYLGSSQGLTRIPATGGEFEQVTIVDTARGEEVHGFPQVLPNGRAVLFTVARAPSSNEALREIAVVDLETGLQRTLKTAVFGRYTTSGHLLFVTAEGNLMAAPFDVDRQRLTGTEVLLLEGFGVPWLRPKSYSFELDGPFSVSEEGTLLYYMAESVSGGESWPVWVARDGSAEPIYPEWEGWMNSPKISPDGTRLAFVKPRLAFNEPGQPSAVWITEFDSGSLLKLTLEGTVYHPTWTPDGRSVTYSSNRAGGFDLWTEPADNSGQPELTLDLEQDLFAPLWSPDGEWLVFRTDDQDSDVSDILAIRPGVDTVPVPLFATAADEDGARLSPDGRWLAFCSDESGRGQVYVVPFPNTGESRSQVSMDGGEVPVWAENGRELFYRNDDSDLVAVQVSTSPTFLALGSTTLAIRFSDFSWPRADYDVTPDGQRLVMTNWPLGSREEPIITPILVYNFFEELREKVGNGND